MLKGVSEMKKKNDKESFAVPSYPPLGTPLNPLGLVITDPFGSYTGRTEDPYEKPVQDADDL